MTDELEKNELEKPVGTAEASEKVNPQKSASEAENKELEAAAQALDQLAESEKTLLPETRRYFDGKEQNHENIIQLIGEAERELADLKLRKALMESDFTPLLDYYHKIFLTKELEASTVAEASAIEYLTYELLKPLEKIGLHYSQTVFDTWETKHFQIHYRKQEDQKLVFELLMPPSFANSKTPVITLLEVDTKAKQAKLFNEAAFTLLELCHAKHLYTVGQLSILNLRVNEVIAHLRELGFDVLDNLLDSSKPLALTVDLPYQVGEKVLDEVFITTMNHDEFDFEKLAAKEYQVQLERSQTVTIAQVPQFKDVTKITLNTADLNKSLLEFFGQYSFLVPLVVKEASN